jgi:hypothetical protein
MKPYHSVAIWAACLGLAAGCVTKESTVVHDAERAKVEFENEAAARTFFEGMEKGGFKPQQMTSSTKFELPIIFEYRRNVTSGPNSGFNRAVEICDTNKDGKITEVEARIFSEHPRP